MQWRLGRVKGEFEMSAINTEEAVKSGSKSATSSETIVFSTQWSRNTCAICEYARLVACRQENKSLNAEPCIPEVTAMSLLFFLAYLSCVVKELLTCLFSILHEFV